ncbi:MAG: tetratricopeptide repeat protein, partial [Ginsengibacter sp.]
MRIIKLYLLFLNGNLGRYIIPLFLGQFLVHNLQAQNQKLDSINQLITKAQTDTGRISLNIKKINILGRSNLDTAIYLGKQQLKEAEKLNFYKGIIRLHNQLASNYSFKGNFDAAKENIQFLEKYIRPSDSLNIADVYSAYGMWYGIQGNYDSSIKLYEKAIALNERLKNTSELPGNYANIAIGYQQLANFSKALEYQQKALNLAEAKKDEQLQAKTLLNMGNTYELIGDTTKAEQSFFKSKDIAVKNGLKIVELYVYTNLATLYISGYKWAKAYDFALKAAALAATAGDIGMQAGSLAKAGLALANQNKFEEATRLSGQAIALADSSTQPINISGAYNAMATTLFLQKKYKEAIPYFEKASRALNGAPNYDPSYVDSYKALSECYEKTGDPVKALANYKTAARIADSIFRKENIRKATVLSMNY